MKKTPSWHIEHVIMDKSSPTGERYELVFEGTFEQCESYMENDTTNRYLMMDSAKWRDTDHGCRAYWIKGVKGQ